MSGVAPDQAAPANENGEDPLTDQERDALDLIVSLVLRMAEAEE